MTDTEPQWAWSPSAGFIRRSEPNNGVADPQEVADALEVNRPWHVMDGMWCPARILEMLAEHGLKVVRA